MTSLCRTTPFVLGMLLFFLPAAHAQDAPLGHQDRAEVVEGLVGLLERHYVLPAMALQLRDTLRARLGRGAYDAFASGAAFARAVTADLQALSGDLHLRLRHGQQDSPGDTRRVIRRDGRGEDDDANAEIFRRMGGIGEAAVLPGNVGYVPIEGFLPRAMEEEQAVAAMEAVAGVDALLFDLRYCQGGTPEMVHFITSYLYDPEPFHLLTYYNARAQPDEAYTLAEVPGTRRPDVPVYILTSPFTASGGEEFTYTLKHHGRATVVGETTRGAGHGGDVHDLPGSFSAFIPDFRPVHPVTGKGWEGVGVIPHIEAAADEALTVAHLEALKRLRAGGLARLDAEINRLEAEAARQPFAETDDTAALAEYAGVYGIRTITYKDGALYLQRNDAQKGATDSQGRRMVAPRLKLRTAGEDAFVPEGLPSAQVVFGRDAEGRVVELRVLNRQGIWETAPRDDP